MTDESKRSPASGLAQATRILSASVQRTPFYPLSALEWQGIRNHLDQLSAQRAVLTSTAGATPGEAPQSAAG